MPAKLTHSAYSSQNSADESLTLKSGYVFYSSLTETKPTLYNTVKKHFQSVKNEVGNKNHISDGAKQLRNYAQAEREKEIQLLKQNFGINFSFENERINPKELTEAINGCLQLKEAYERNIKRIAAGQAKIDITMFFESYFKEAWGKITKDREDDIVKAIADDDSAAINKIVMELTENSFDIAWDKMWNSDTFKGLDDHTYQFLKDSMGSFKNIGTFANQIWNTYNLTGFQSKMEKYYKQLASVGGKTEQSRAVRSKTQAGKMLDTKNGNVGEIREQFVTFLVNEMGKIKVDNEEAKIRVEAVQTGMHKIKADEIFSYGVDLDPILAEIQTLKVGDSRQEFKEAFDRIYKHVKNLDEGFIVYSNSKNYTLVKKQLADGYKFSGFSAGTAGNIEFLKNLYRSRDVEHSEAFFNSIINAGNSDDSVDITIGAEVGIKEELENSLVQDIAWFLFDDYDTIGTNQTKAKVLHIMDLDGIFFPLSVFLDLCAIALEKVAEEVIDNPKAIVDIDIQPKEIMYPVGPWGTERWNIQRRESIDNTEIKVKFLSNFAELVKDLLVNN